MYWKNNIYIYKYLFWALHTPFLRLWSRKKWLKNFSVPYGLKENMCYVSTIYLCYFRSYYKLQETSEVLFHNKQFSQNTLFDCIYSILRPSRPLILELVKVQYKSYHINFYTYLIKGNNVGGYQFFFEFLLII